RAPLAVYDSVLERLGRGRPRVGASLLPDELDEIQAATGPRVVGLGLRALQERNRDRPPTGRAGGEAGPTTDGGHRHAVRPGEIGLRHLLPAVPVPCLVDGQIHEV